MNIFQKSCPECAASNPADAISCECGYAFDPEALAGADPAVYAHEQDRLYRDYLAARVAQAQAELAVARELADAEPENTYKASGALLAEQAVNALQAEMKQLSLRISAAPARPAPKPAVRATPKPPPTRATPAPPVTPTRQQKPPQPAPAVAPKSRAAPQVPAHRAEPPKARHAPAARAPAGAGTQSNSRPAPPAAPPSRPAVAQARQKAAPGMRAKAAPTPPSATAPKNSPKPPAQATSPGNGAPRIPETASSARPDDSFRRLQNRKAEAIAQSKTLPAATPHQPPSPPADVPPLALTKKNPTQECPNCTASVAASLTRCTCGYILSHPGEEVPAVALDATALAILTDGISFNSSNRRR